MLKVINNGKEIERSNEGVTAEMLIQLCAEHGVAFMDLIPIALPELDTKLRENWSINKEYQIDEKARVITFLEIAFEYFIDKTKCKISPQAKVALMMPPKTALGILNFFLDKGNNTNVVELNKLRESFVAVNSNSNARQFPDRALRLHKSVVMSGAGGPNEDLIYDAFK